MNNYNNLSEFMANFRERLTFLNDCVETEKRANLYKTKQETYFQKELKKTQKAYKIIVGYELRFETS